MKKTDSPQLEALEALLAEKRKHEGYIAKLEERRAGTPEHVFARLRDEYLSKVMDAQVRAHAEAEALEDGLEVDQAAVSDVEARLAALEEERLEGDLRAAVGELDLKDWQKRLIALNASISMGEKERDALTSSALRIRALLAEARGVPVMPAAITEPVSAKPVPRTSAAAAAIANAPNFDELAFLNSVVGRTSSPAMPMPVSPAPAPRVSVPVAPIKESPSVKDPASVREPSSIREMSSVREPISAPKAEPISAPKPEPIAAAPEPVAAPQPEPASAPEPAAAPKSEFTAAPELALGTSAAPVEPTPAPTPVPVPAPAPAPVAAAPEPVNPEDEEPPSALGRATSRSTQAIKTLKCGECGSMNYPTEWYCERCGGELAAL